MALELIKNEIGKFLSSDVSEVLAISGKWGVGKTYAWNKFILEFRDARSISLSKYAYVSLFGVDSIDALKKSIFLNTVPTSEIGKPITLDNFKKTNASSVFKMISKFIPKDSIPRWVPIQMVTELFSSQTIICLDDFERISNDFDQASIMGLVSLLKEEKNCKVVLLLNEDMLGDRGEGVESKYSHYREKVVDIDLRFEPSSEESINIALCECGAIYDALRITALRLDICNIRVLRKIESFVTKISDYCETFDSETVNQIVNSLVLFVLAKYSIGELNHVPPLEFIESYNIEYGESGTIKGEFTNDSEADKYPDERVWKEYLSDFGYAYTNALDRVLIDFVKNGYLNDIDFSKRAKIFNDETISRKQIDNHYESYRLLGNNFEDNTDELVDNIRNSFFRNVKNINLAGLEYAITLLKDLGLEHIAKEILEFYIEERSDTPKLFDLERDSFGDIQDVDIVERFNSKFRQSEKLEPLKCIIHNISKSGWNQKDEELLSSATVEEFYQAFKSIEGVDLREGVKGCLRFRSISNASDRQKKIAEKATLALKRIGAESRINQIRVKRYYEIEIIDS